MKATNPVRYTTTWEIFAAPVAPATHIVVKGKLVKLGRGK